MKKKLREVATIKFCILEKGNDKKFLLTAANLLENNRLSEVHIDDKLKKDSSLLLEKDDIIIKRINPSYVNYLDEINEEIYAGNNLIIVKAVGVDAQYLASILDANIEKLAKKNSVGAIVPSIGRKEMEEFDIEICSQEKQRLIGEYWIKTIKKRNLEIRKIELEKQKSTAIIKSLINEMGGIKND